MRARGWIAAAMLASSLVRQLGPTVGEWWPLLVLWAAVACFVGLIACIATAAKRADAALELEPEDELERLWRL